jgi:hypothetical protein
MRFRLAVNHKENDMHHTVSAAEQNGTRAAGVALIASTLLSIATVAQDVGPSGRNKAEILASMVNLHVRHQLVHVVALACLLGFAFGVITLAQRAGLRRPAVLAGLVCYLAGCLAMVGAVMCDGFITVDLALKFASGSPEEVATGYGLIQFTNVVLQDLATVSWALQAVGVLLLSAALFSGQGRRRVPGVVGLVSGALPILALAYAYPHMGLALVVGIMVAQSAWHLCAGAWLLRGDAPATARTPLPAAA